MHIHLAIVVVNIDYHLGRICKHLGEKPPAEWRGIN